MSTPGKAWTIEVYREIELLGCYEVPLHRLETNGVADLLKAIVSKYEEFEFQELVDSYLNKRKGGPGRCLIGPAKYFADTEKATSGYWVFGPTVSACARYPLSPEACDFIRKNRNPVSG